MASIDFKKIKDKKQLQALLRHSEKDKRLKSRHTNRNIDRDTFIMIDTILQKRRYRLRMERGNLFVRYIGKTTYGTDNDILQDGI